MPRRFGKFELRQKIGSGSFGVVYRAWDTILKREVAVKIPRPEAIAAHQDVRAFLREARTAIDLRHPNIVAIYDAGPIEGIVCIVRAYIEGSTLAEQIRDAPLAPEESAALMTQVAEALEAAHRQGIIHRDLKPSNILLDLQGQPHISDFGLAKRESGDSTLSPVGNFGAMIGTPAYMSPEQSRGNPQGVDRRSDVFSAGVVLYELLTGAVPFRGRGRLLLAQIQELEPTPPCSLNEDVTPDLESICLKALAKDPADRYQSAQELADDLRTFLGGQSISPRPRRRNPRSGVRRGSRSLALAIPAGLLLLLIVTTFFWRTTEKRRSQDVGLTERSYRALLELSRPVELMSPSASERPEPLTSRIWSEVENLAPLLEDDPSLLGLAAEAQRTIAERARSRGSDQLAVSHWEKTVAFTEKLVKLDPKSHPHREILAVGLTNLAMIRGRSSFNKSESHQFLERSITLWREILNDRRQSIESRPEDPDLQLDLAEALLQVAVVDLQLGKLDDLTEVTRILPGLKYRSTLGLSARVRLARLTLGLASLQLSGQLKMKSLHSAEQAHLHYKEIPAGPIAEIGIAWVFLIKARANRELDRLAEAKQHYRQAIKSFDGLVQADPESPDLRRALGAAEFELGQLLDPKDPRSDAIAIYRKSLQIREDLVKNEPNGYLNLLERAESRSALSLALDPDEKVLDSVRLGLLAIGDRLKVFRLAPGLDENRRDLGRCSLFTLGQVRQPRTWLELLRRLQNRWSTDRARI